MLIEYSSIAALDPMAKERLTKSANYLLQTNEAIRASYVMFEGKYFHAADVRSLCGNTRQFLQEG